MHDHPAEGLTRRDALLGLVAVGIAGLAAVAPPARAESTKLAKADVQYVDDGKVPHKDCDDCSRFVPGANPGALGSCRIVAGTISPHGHCIAFSPRPRP